METNDERINARTTSEPYLYQRHPSSITKTQTMARRYQPASTLKTMSTEALATHPRAPTVASGKRPAPSIDARRMLVKPLSRPMIIEKWLRYKSGIERPPTQQGPTRSTARETHRHTKPDVTNFGCFRVDPEIYRSRYECEFRSKQCIGRILENLGYGAALIALLGYETSRVSSHYDHLQTGPSRPSPHYDTPRIHDHESPYLPCRYHHRETLT